MKRINENADRSDDFLNVSIFERFTSEQNHLRQNRSVVFILLRGERIKMVNGDYQINFRRITVQHSSGA